ncbi:MAG TPA: response regulator [Gemmatimonadales bacterium]|nr:response regulator [Gemmatimonadales bacterium]
MAPPPHDRSAPRPPERAPAREAPAAPDAARLPLIAALGVEQDWVRRLLQLEIIGILVAQDGRIVEANDTFLAMVGYARADLEAGRLRWPDITPPEHFGADEHALEELTRLGGCTPYEKEYLRQDGTRVPVLLVASALSGEPLRAVAFVLDLTGRKALERRVRQAQRIDSVVQLAGGIAHDFNNLLTTIIGAAELLLDHPDLDADARDDADQIRLAANRAAQLTQQLLAFGRRQVLRPVVLDLNALVDDVHRLLRRLIGESVELLTDLAPSLDPVLADRAQLEQVLADLVLRARDAMPQGGRIVIATENVTVDAGFAESRPGLSPGRHVVLSVRDSGAAIDRAALDRIFEPFAVGATRGEAARAETGLGLASLYGIVKQSGGHAEAQSEPGQGATFTIYLPAVRRRPSREELAVDGASAEAPGGESVLLVEDDEQVRGLTRRVLERAGYTVAAAADAQSAVALANRHPGTIHLLIVDMMLPGLSGRELAAQLAIHRPAVKVLYISGTADDAIGRDRVLAPGIEFLQKPFARDQLVRKVRQVLDAPLARS